MLSRSGNAFRNRRRNSRILWAGLFLLSALIYFTNLGNDESFQKTRQNAEGFGATVLTYLTLPARGFENFVGDIRGRFTAHSENERLRAEVSRLSDAEARANALAVKISRFETILNIDVGSGIPERIIAARAVSEINGPFARTALINAGANKGLSVGDAVMTVDGLYGHIIRAGNSSARVLKLEDLNSRIAVMSKETQSRAILVGNNTNDPDLTFLSDQSDWKIGNTVITSGDDGVLPMGLQVGTLFETGNGERKVKLFATENFVDWVWVYPYEPVKPPEDDPVEEDLSIEGEQVVDDTSENDQDSTASQTSEDEL